MGQTLKMASSGNGSTAVCEISIYMDDVYLLCIYAEAKSEASQAKAEASIAHTNKKQVPP
jgi:hypothetical protein